jgi:NTE family protein
MLLSGKLVFLALACFVFATGCTPIPATTPLNAAPRSSGTDQVVPDPRYELLELTGPARGDDLLIFLAFSGGGKRSSAFSYGVLEGLRDLELAPASESGLRDRLLDRVDMITGVSGGSFTAAAFGLRGDAMFDTYREKFLYDDTGARITGLYLLPWNWEWLFSPTIGRNDEMARIYDDLLFEGATFADLHARGRPQIVLGATDIVLGSSFIFTQRHFDLLCANLNAYPLSQAVAASNGFPGLFSTITLKSQRTRCPPNEPDWLEPLAHIEQGKFQREAIIAEEYRRYLDPRIEYVHLMDGGIADNLALRGLLNALVLFNQIPRLPPGNEYLGIRRVLVVSVDGEGGNDLTWAKQSDISGPAPILAAVSGTQIDRYNGETLLLANETVEDFGTHLRMLRCAHAAIINGKPCGDVDAKFVHLSLRGIADRALRERLLAIPTGLTLEPEQADELAAAGRDAVLRSEEFSSLIRRP